MVSQSSSQIMYSPSQCCITSFICMMVICTYLYMHVFISIGGRIKINQSINLIDGYRIYKIHKDINIDYHKKAPTMSL